MASSKTESNITTQKIQRSISPSGRSFCSSSSSSLSPNRNSVDRNGNSVSSSPSVCFSSIDHHRNGNSSDRSIASSSSPRERNQNQNQSSNQRSSSNGQKKKKCMCSPTTHPGSFRCSLHRNVISTARNVVNNQSNNNARRSAISNSIARIGTVEGDSVKRSLASLLIRPSSHQQKRRGEFQPKPSRLSVMSKADM